MQSVRRSESERSLGVGKVVAGVAVAGMAEDLVVAGAGAETRDVKEDGATTERIYRSLKE
jgi:hypothetical protein